MSPYGEYPDLVSMGVLLYKPTFFLVKSHVFKAHPFQVQFLFPATLQPVGIDMVVSNTVIVDRSPQAADPSLNRTTNTRSPDIQELLNEDNPQTRKIYYFQNCGTVYMPVDSFNARGVRMENCGNNVPQVNCSLFIFPFSFLMIQLGHYYINQITVLRLLAMRKFKLYIHNLMQFSMVCGHLGHLPLNILVHVEYVFPPLGPQNETGPPTASTEINHNNVHLQTNALYTPQSPQHTSPSQFSGDHTHLNIKHLEQLLDSSLATVAVIQFSGNTLADVLTPRAYDTFKALYALAALDAPASSSTNLKSRESETPTLSTFSDIVDSNN